VAVGEELLDEGTVGAAHAGVVDGDAIGEQLAEIFVECRLGLPLQDLTARVGLGDSTGRERA